MINAAPHLNKNMEKLSNALNILDGIAKNYDVFIPSLNKKVKFKGFTTKQQKDAVKSALEKVSTGLSFTLLLNSVLKENCSEPIDLLLTDRSYVAACLRVLSLSPTVLQEDEKIDISFILNKNLPLPQEIRSAEIIDENIKIYASIPTLSKDSNINIETKKKLVPLPDNDDITKEAVGEIYINELVKYIEKITINNAGNLIDIDFNELNLQQKVQVIEKLPLSANTKLIEYINKVKSFEKELFTNNNVEVVLTIDPSLFTV